MGVASVWLQLAAGKEIMLAPRLEQAILQTATLEEQEMHASLMSAGQGMGGIAAFPIVVPEGVRSVARP